MAKIKVDFYPTQRKFIESSAPIVAIIGPQGEGKTFTGFWAAMVHAKRQPKGQTLRGAIIRDTFENIKRMTIPSIREAAEPIIDRVQFRDGGRKLLAPNLDLDLMGIDDIATLTKLQGAEYGFIWLEEPAPILDKANAGLSEDVFNVAMTRSARQKNSVPRLQVTMNPADEDHWTYHRLIENPSHNEEKGIWTDVFDIPYGENTTLTDITRELVKEGYATSPELYQRYVEGKFSFVTKGEKVTPAYNEDLHRAKVKLNPLPNLGCLRFWDGGLNPTCIICQVTPRGRLFVLDTLRGENIGLKQLCDSKLKPLLGSPRYEKITEWRDIGDPSMHNKEQSNSEVSAASILKDELNSTLERGPSKWEPRREAVRMSLNLMIDGQPMVVLSQHEGILHRAFRGGWHYKKDNSGKLKDIPEKDIHSHPGDAFSHGIGKLLPWKPQRKPNPKLSQQMRNRAKGYTQ